MGPYSSYNIRVWVPPTTELTHSLWGGGVTSTLQQVKCLNQSYVIKSMQNMMVAMATIIQTVCRSDHDLSGYKMCFSFHVIEQFGCSDIFILIRNITIKCHNTFLPIHKLSLKRFMERTSLQS